MEQVVAVGQAGNFVSLHYTAFAGAAVPNTLTAGATTGVHVAIATHVPVAEPEAGTHYEVDKHCVAALGEAPPYSTLSTPLAEVHAEISELA